MELTDEPPRALRDAFRGVGWHGEVHVEGFQPLLFPACPTATSSARPPPLQSSPLLSVCARLLHGANTNSIIYAWQNTPLITHERAHAPDAPRHPPTAIKHSLKACYLILAHLSLSEDILKINKSASDLHMHSSWYLYSAGASPKGLSYYLCPRVLARRPGRQAGD